MSQNGEKRRRQDQCRHSWVLSGMLQVLIIIITMNEPSQDTSSWNFKNIKDKNPKNPSPENGLSMRKWELDWTPVLSAVRGFWTLEEFQVHRERWLSTCLYTLRNLSRCFQICAGSPPLCLFLGRDLAMYCSRKRNKPWKRKAWFSGNGTLIWSVMKGSSDNCKWPGVTNPKWNRRREEWERLERAGKDKGNNATQKLSHCWRK